MEGDPLKGRSQQSRSIWTVHHELGPAPVLILLLAARELQLESGQQKTTNFDDAVLMEEEYNDGN